MYIALSINYDGSLIILPFISCFIQVFPLTTFLLFPMRLSTTMSISLGLIPGDKEDKTLESMEGNSDSSLEKLSIEVFLTQ